jgi:hypothetical protein
MSRTRPRVLVALLVALAAGLGLAAHPTGAAAKVHKARSTRPTPTTSPASHGCWC